MTNQTNAMRKDMLIQDYLSAHAAFERAKKRAEDAFHETNQPGLWARSTKCRLAQIEYRLALDDEATAQAKRDASYTALFNAIK